MEILVGNKLIAEFMGWRKDPVHGWLPEGKNDSYNYGRDDSLLFNSSWDWLMPVIEKIEKHKFPESDTTDEIYNYAFVRTFYKNMFRINRYQLFNEETKIVSAWKSVVDFITHNLKDNSYVSFEQFIQSLISTEQGQRVLRENPSKEERIRLFTRVTGIEIK